jgi:hypothetical protein
VFFTRFLHSLASVQGRRGRSYRPGAWLALTVGLLVATGSAQSPASLGGWEGPFDWTAQIGGPPASSPCSAEFSHAVLIPTGNYRGKVMLWRFELNAACIGSNTFQTWIMDTTLQGPSPVLIRVPQSPALLTDIFCSGASWDVNGELVVVGGTQYTAGGGFTQGNRIFL